MKAIPSIIPALVITFLFEAFGFGFILGAILVFIGFYNDKSIDYFILFTLVIMVKKIFYKNEKIIRKMKDLIWVACFCVAYVAIGESIEFIYDSSSAAVEALNREKEFLLGMLAIVLLVISYINAKRNKL